MTVSTTRLAAAITPFFRASQEMVAEWCEAGLIRARRNPSKESYAKWQIVPAGIPLFLRSVLDFDEAEICEVEKRLGINFRQLLLVAA